MSSRGDRVFGDRPWLWEAVAGLAALACYVRTVRYGWVFEDRPEVVLNTYAHSFGNLFRILSSTVWEGSGTETFLYRPLLVLSYAGNHLISGLQPWSYHLANAMLFAGVTLLVIRVGRLLGLPSLAAGLAGLVFAIHPVHVESVVPVVGRRDLLVALFVLAMVVLHERAVARGGWRLALPVLAQALAIFSKEVGIVGIALVGTCDWLMPNRWEGSVRNERRHRLYIGYAVVLLAYHAVRIRVTGGVGIPAGSLLENPLIDAPVLVRLGTALAVIGKGMLLQVLPLTQSPDYSFNAIPLVTTPLDGRFLVTLIFMAAGGWWVFHVRSRRPTVALLGVWYLVAILPTANILAPLGAIFAERFLFLASVPFCLAAGWAGALGLRKSPRIVVPLIALWMVGLSVQTVRYTGAWTDDVSLFSFAVERVPQSTKAHHQLGASLLRAGQLGAALAPLRRAIDIAPENQFAAGTLARARILIRERYLPRGGEAPDPEVLPRDPEILHTLAQISREREDFSMAEAYWEAALAVDSLHAPSHADLGGIKFLRGDLDGALSHLRTAIRLDPDLAGAWFNLGRLELLRGNRADAVNALEFFLATAGSQYPSLVEWTQDTLVYLRGF